MKKLLLTLGVTLTLNTSALMAQLTQTQLNAVLNIVTNFILDDGIINHNGTTYKTVTSPYTGRVWLDRNLGASQVCTSFDDVACYGDYYQWGRAHDGHQVSISSNTPILANDVSSVGDGNFITSANDWASVDSNGSLRAFNWSKSDGTSVCPSGFRVPTLSELQAETVDNNVTNRDTAFSNFLKLPSAGFRAKASGVMISENNKGALWVSSVYGSNSRSMYFDINSANDNTVKRASGRSVRCIKNTIPADIVPPIITIIGGVTLNVLLNDSYSDAGATAIDDIDGNLTVTSTGTVDTTTPGDYTITYTATDSAGNVARAVKTVSVLNSVTHNGTTYKTVTSPYTGRVWLDRNLGALQVCTSFDDPLCYGDYYQWGRDYDGHQESNSSTTTILTPTSNTPGSIFIINTEFPYDWISADSNGNLRSAHWSSVDGSSICPIGFRVPTIDELSAESAGMANNNDAFNSFLKLPSAGYREYINGLMIGVGSLGTVSSSSATGIYMSYLGYNSGNAGVNNNGERGSGRSVRCLKD